jgi:hypothetical protein
MRASLVPIHLFLESQRREVEGEPVGACLLLDLADLVAEVLALSV